MPKISELEPDVVRARIDEIVAMWDVDGIEKIQILARDHESVGLTLFGLASHCVALARAVRTLEGTDDGAAIVPLVRQMLECTITAVWLQTYGARASVKIHSEDARARLATFKNFVEAGYADDGSIKHWQSELDSLAPLTTKASEKVYERCQEIEGFSSLYAEYRAFSSLSHASAMVVDLYIEKRPNGRIEAAAQAKDWARDAVVGLSLIYLLLAVRAWDTYEKGHPRRTRLKEIAAEMNIRLEWKQTAAGLKRQSEWERQKKARAIAVLRT